MWLSLITHCLVLITQALLTLELGSSMDVKYSMIFILYYLQLRDNLEPFQPDWKHFVNDRDEWNQIDKISKLGSYMDSLRH